MNAYDEWSRWGDDWQQQPAVDVEHLRRRVQRKRWQMRIVVALEGIIALFATVQVLRLLLDPGITLRWKIWAILALALVAESIFVALRLRRGTWQAAGGSVTDLLKLTAKQARAGIKLGWLNIAGFVALLGFTLPLAAPWLAPSRWLHDAALQHLLILQLAINGIVAAALLVFLACYIRRQRRKLRRAEAMLREYARFT